MLTMELLWWHWTIGIALALFGAFICWWALWRDRSRGRRRCPKCWYDLSASAGLRCSECGHEARDERRLHRTRRRLVPGAIGIVVLLTFPGFLLARHGWARGWQYAFLPTWRVVNSVDVKGFQVERLETNQKSWSAFARAVRVRRNGHTLLHMKTMYNSIGSRSPTASQPIGVGDDITGNGAPNLIVTEDSGGTGCYQTHYVFELRNDDAFVEFKPIAVLHHCGYFEDVNDDGVAEFIARDRTFAYHWTGGGESPYPRVVMEWQGEDYEVAPNLMRESKPTEAEIIARFDSFRIPGDNWHVRFAAVLEITLDLIFAGHEALAWDVFDRYWPGDLEGGYQKDEFRLELAEALRQSPFWPHLVVLNQPDDPSASTHITAASPE